jgi:hypothetical protein
MQELESEKGGFFMPHYIILDTDLRINEKFVMCVIHNNLPCTLTNDEIKQIANLKISAKQIAYILKKLQNIGKIILRYNESGLTKNDKKTREITIKEIKEVDISFIEEAHKLHEIK